MIAFLFQTESSRSQFFSARPCVGRRGIARSFIKLLDVEDPAGREVAARNCGALVRRSGEPIDRAGVGFRPSLSFPCYAPRRGTDTQDI